MNFEWIIQFVPYRDLWLKDIITPFNYSFAQIGIKNIHLVDVNEGYSGNGGGGGILKTIENHLGLAAIGVLGIILLLKR